MFRYYSCSFKITPAKEKTARAIIFRTFHIPNCFTIEASNGSWYHNSVTTSFVEDDYINMGIFIGQGLC